MFLFGQKASMDTLLKYGTPKEIKKPVGQELHRMDPIQNPSRKRNKRKRKKAIGNDDSNAELAADIEKLQRTRNLCSMSIANLETKLARDMKSINAQQVMLEVGQLKRCDIHA